MRINGFDKISIGQAVGYQKINKKQEIKKEDAFQISELGSDYQFAMKKVHESELNRSEKVDRIKKEIENRTYNISAQDVASKMLKDLSLQFSI